MAEFPIQRARQELGFTPATSVRTDIQVPTDTSGAALGQALIGGIKLKQEYDLKVANVQLSEYKRNVGLDNIQRDIEIAAELDPDKHPEIYKRHEESQKAMMPKSRIGARGATLWNNKQIVLNAEKLSEGMNNRADDNWDTEAALKIAGIKQDGDPVKLAEFEKFLARRQIYDPMDRSRAAGLLSLAREEYKKGVVENIKPGLIAVIKTGDKTDGYKLLDSATKQLVKNGILTEAEAAEANKKLGDWIDNYVSGRIKQAKDIVKLTTQQTYAELSKPIVNGLLTYDDIDQSKLLKDDKEKWYGYIKGSYKDAPIDNTPTGHTVSFNAVYDAATLQLSPKEAYDVLLEARFNDRTITSDQFEWAIDKIENPYPKHLTEDIRAVLKSNLEDFNRTFSFDNERNKKVNESLLGWIDELIKQDKVPPFDFKKKMVAMSSQFRVGNDRWYDIGQIINRGGRQWEVMGFDENGEPLVEEIE